MPRPILTALQTGTEPLAPLPEAAFHRTLEEPIYCPKCQATYFLVADYDWVISRFFEGESRRHLTLLRKAIFLEHGAGHPSTQMDTNGVSITRHAPPRPDAPQTAPDKHSLTKLAPLTRRVN